MIRIGVVNIDVSHPKSWAGLLAEGDRARYVAVHNDGFRGNDEVEAFVETFGLEKICSSVEELADMVDIVFVQGCNWDKHLDSAREVIAQGKPVFIDKPIVGSILQCHALEKLAEEGGTILGSSSVRYAYEIENFLARPESERGEIMHVYGTAGVDEFNYAIHTVEAIGGLIGTGAESVRFTGRATRNEKKCETFHVSFGEKATATYCTFEGQGMPFQLVILTTTGAFQFTIDAGKIYKAVLDRICDYLETGENRLAPVRDLTESVKIMLAGRLSRERSGILVNIADIPPDDPGYDGNAFEKAYAAKATKIYID